MLVTGQFFWGRHFSPLPLFFRRQSVHVDFVLSAANLHAVTYGIAQNRDPAYIRKVSESVKVAEFVPKSGEFHKREPKRKDTLEM